jgi:hypothetical protein
VDCCRSPRHPDEEFGAFNKAMTTAVANASKVTAGMKIVVADA